VTDSSGAVIPNAEVSITNSATGVTRTVTSGSAGLYTAPNLLPGIYDIRITAPGFSTQVQKGITLTVGAQQALDIKMQVGQVSQTVEVTTEAPTVELTSSTISAVVNATTVRELPLNAALGPIWPLSARCQFHPDAAILRGRWRPREPRLWVPTDDLRSAPARKQLSAGWDQS